MSEKQQSFLSNGWRRNVYVPAVVTHPPLPVRNERDLIESDRAGPPDVSAPPPPAMTPPDSPPCQQASGDKSMASTAAGNTPERRLPRPAVRIWLAAVAWISFLLCPLLTYLSTLLGPSLLWLALGLLGLFWLASLVLAGLDLIDRIQQALWQPGIHLPHPHRDDHENHS